MSNVSCRWIKIASIPFKSVTNSGICSLVSLIKDLRSFSSTVERREVVLANDSCLELEGHILEREDERDI